MSEPQIAMKQPCHVEVEAGKTYSWCACGLSKSQPYCDGAHAGTGIMPMFYKAEESKTVSFCGCKQSANKPFCDGSHGKL